MQTAVKKVKHPYIMVNKRIRGGEPVIAGTGIRVLDIAINALRIKQDIKIEER